MFYEVPRRYGDAFLRDCVAGFGCFEPDEAAVLLILPAEWRESVEHAAWVAGTGSLRSERARLVNDFVKRGYRPPRVAGPL